MITEDPINAGKRADRRWAVADYTRVDEEDLAQIKEVFDRVGWNWHLRKLYVEVVRLKAENAKLLGLLGGLGEGETGC